MVTYGGIPPAGAGFEIKNVGTAVARGPVHYEVSAYQNAGGFRTLRRTTLELPLPQGGLAPGRRASTEIPEHVLDPAQRTSYDDVQVYIDSELAVDELDESNNRRAIH